MATIRAGGRPIKVIHIDDDEDQLVFAKLFLEQADPGLRITSTDDPQKVLSLLEGDEYECLVSDYCMPKMDGITLANKAREKSDLHIIVYTGQGSEEVAEAAFASGVDDYLRKEVDPSHYRVLAKRIRHSVEKRRTERLLRTRERELSWMVEHSSDAIFRIEFDKGVTRYNPAFAKLYGPIEGDVIPMADLVPSRIPHEGYRRFEQVTAETLARNQTQFKLLHKWVDSDGTELWFETQISAIIRDGEMKGFEATSRDVTDMKRVEAELLQSKGSLLNFVNSATDLVVLLDHGLGIVEVNPAGLELWHKTRDEVVGRNIQEFEPFIGDPERLEILHRALKTGALSPLEDIVPHPEDPHRHIKLRIFKTSEGLGVISSDVSETMMFQRELEESEKKLQILVDNIPDVFYIQGRVGMVFVSPNVSKMTGFTSDEVTKPDPGFWGTLIYHEDAGRVREAKRRYIEENKPYDVE
ncbi:PAS domain S-box protein, partial [Candidatus Bathyarchaeota archaeon]|nr:PAS domain S-box protein [Candidatus Bathyarchaeota archaeon]